MSPRVYENCAKYFQKAILAELDKQGIYTWCGGGALRDYFSKGYTKSDFDLYFATDEMHDKALDYLLKSLNEVVSETEEPMILPKKQAVLMYENEQVTKLSYKGKTLDIIKMRFDNPQACIDMFDFTVSCCAVDTAGVVTHHEDFFADLARKALVINALPMPASTQWRMQKYILKGFRICKEEMLKLMTAVCTLELHKTEDQEEPIETQEIDEKLLSSGGSDLFRGID